MNSDLNIYSPEPFEDLFSVVSGNNGDVLKSVSINRKNRASLIYIKFASTGRFIPKVYRGYYNENQELKYHSTEYSIVESTQTEVIFKYDMMEDYNYVTYRIEFECLNDNMTINVEETGVIFDRIVSSSDNTHTIGTNLLMDINSIPLFEQSYYENLSFTLLVNRTDLGQILNILEKPYFLVDIKDGCINNSSSKLVETGISPNFVTTATKMMTINIQNIVGDNE